MGIFSSEAKALLESNAKEDVCMESLEISLIEESIDLVIESNFSDAKFDFKPSLLENPEKVKEICKIIEDDMTKPSLRNFLANQLFFLIIAVPITAMAVFAGSVAGPLGAILLGFTYSSLIYYFSVDLSFKRHNAMIYKIDQRMAALRNIDRGNENKTVQFQLAELEKSKKILDEARAKYVKAEKEKFKDKPIGFILGKAAQLY